MNRWLPTPTGLVGKRDSEDAGLLRDPLNERFEPLCSSFLKGGRRLPQRELRDVEIVGCIPETHHAGGKLCIRLQEARRIRRSSCFPKRAVP
jgi:hypothetical protein